MRCSPSSILSTLGTLSSGRASTGEGGVRCVFYDGVENVELIDTLVCVEGGGGDCSTEPWSKEYGA